MIRSEQEVARSHLERPPAVSPDRFERAHGRMTDGQDREAGKLPNNCRSGRICIDGAGERLFEGFGESLELEHLGVRQSPFATFIGHRVKSEGGES